MNSTRLFVLALALVLALAGCAAPAAQVTTSPATSPAPVLTGGAPRTSVQASIPSPSPTTTQTKSPATATIEANTQTATPTPEPTIPPTPVSLNIDTAPAFQVIGESTYTGGEGQRFRMAFSPNTHQLAFAGCENGKDTFCTLSVFRLIDADTGQVIRELDSLSPIIEVLKFSPDGRLLAAAGCDLTLALYGEADTNCDQPRAWLVDTTTGKMLFEMKGYESNLTSMIFSPDGTKLFTSVIHTPNNNRGDYSIHIYDVATGKVITILVPQMETGQNLYFTLDLSPDGRYLLTDALNLGSGASSFVEWWDIQEAAHPRKVATVNYAYHYSVSPDSSRLVVQSPGDNTLHLYNLVTGESIRPIPASNLDALARFSFVTDGNTLLLDYQKKGLDITRIDSGETIKRLQPDYGPPDYLFSPDHRLLLTWGYKTDDGGVEASKNISVWDTSTWQEVPVSTRDTVLVAIYLVAFNSDLTKLYAITDIYPTINIETWGFPEAKQNEAEKALVQYFNLLGEGSYAQAAALVKLENQKSYTDYIQNNTTGIAPGDLATVLKELCSDPVFPCMPVRDVLYRSQLAAGHYRFVIDFRAPDGSAAPWPACDKYPMNYSCSHRNGMFWYDVNQMEDGSFYVWNWPPSIYLYYK